MRNIIVLFFMVSVSGAIMLMTMMYSFFLNKSGKLHLPKADVVPNAATSDFTHQTENSSTKAVIKIISSRSRMVSMYSQYQGTMRSTNSFSEHISIISPIFTRACFRTFLSVNLNHI